MSERELVLALGEREGFGELVKVASPSYSNEVGCVLPMGLVCIAACVTEFFKQKHTWLADVFEVVELLVGIGILGTLASPWIRRRPGGSEPRLYCFAEGVVVAVESHLTAYRWNELRVEVKDWRRGNGDEVESGTQTTVFVDATGAFVVQFTGIEPGKSGAALLSRLHRSALDRAADA